jgi:hypothetical protein
MPIGSTVRTTGVVVAEAGRLGTPALLGIGDDDHGLVVHLPTGVAGYPRGSHIEVAGTLAAPYGQLEIRPAKGGIRALGTGSLPVPTAVPAAGLTESMEGRLVTLTGRLTTKPKKSATGDLMLILEREGQTSVKVMADVSSRIAIGNLKVGSTYRIVGFVGQRATRSGALDGYRVWARDTADVRIVTGASNPGTPSATPGPGSTHPAPSTGAPERLTIARALRVSDRAVAIDAVVTAPATLLDATGRRIVVQDGSGGIEVLLPTGTAAPPVGARIYAEGRIGVAYGAPRLRADTLVLDGSAAIPAAIVLHGPPGDAHEWELVAVTGRIASIHKLGDRWRAEIVVGARNVVVVGEKGAGIASSVLAEGRNTTVTGIVRRPFPNATDRRFAVTPRFPADLRVDGAATGTPAPAGTTSGGPSPAAQGTRPGGSTVSDDPLMGATDADLVDLDTMVGRLVRVGGLVVELRPDGFTLDDGTAIGRVMLRAAALDQLALVEPDDALNAIGRVEATAAGAVVVVDDPAGLLQAGDPVGADPSPSASESASARAIEPSGSAGSAGRLAGLGGGPFPLEPGAAGFGTLVLISVASVVLTVLRRVHGRRRMTARIAGRLATFAGPSAGLSAGPLGGPLADPSGTIAAERAPSTNHSA